MSNYTTIFLALLLVTIFQQSKSLECYVCPSTTSDNTPTICEFSKATVKQCGQPTDTAQEALCVTETVKGKDAVKESIRKCVIISKGTKLPCPSNSKCEGCKEDKCNKPMSPPATTAKPSTAATSFATGGAIISALVLAKLIH